MLGQQLSTGTGDELLLDDIVLEKYVPGEPKLSLYFFCHL